MGSAPFTDTQSPLTSTSRGERPSGQGGPETARKQTDNDPLAYGKRASNCTKVHPDIQRAIVAKRGPRFALLPQDVSKAPTQPSPVAGGRLGKALVDSGRRRQ